MNLLFRYLKKQILVYYRMKFFIGRFYVNLVLKFNIKLELLEEDIMGMEEIKK